MNDDWLNGLRFGLIAGTLATVGVGALLAVIWAAVRIGEEILRIAG